MPADSGESRRRVTHQRPPLAPLLPPIRPPLLISLLRVFLRGALRLQQEGSQGGRASRFPRPIWSTGAAPTSNRPGRSIGHRRRKPGRDTRGALVGGSHPAMVDVKIIITVELGYISYSEARVIPIRQLTALRCPSSIGRISIPEMDTIREKRSNTRVRELRENLLKLRSQQIRNLHFGSESDDMRSQLNNKRNLHVWCALNLLKEVGWRLYVDMNLFLGFGREHVPWNFEKTENHVYLHVVQWQKPNHDKPECSLKKPLYSPSYAGAKVIPRSFSVHTDDMSRGQVC